MTLKILHLYSGLMNLYGEYANVSILERRLREQGFEVEVVKADSCADISFSDFDFIYIGSGTESAQKRALEDIMTKQAEFTSASESGAVMLLTGNAFEMLGRSVTDGNGKGFKALGLCAFETTESGERRITGDAICTCRFVAGELVGFINKCSETVGVYEPLFEMIMGVGNSLNDKGEGCRFKNVFGTHLIGPVLVKNPHFTKYMVELITKDIEGFSYNDKDAALIYERGAYEVTLSELKKRLAQA